MIWVVNQSFDKEIIIRVSTNSKLTVVLNQSYASYFLLFAAYMVYALKRVVKERCVGVRIMYVKCVERSNIDNNDIKNYMKRDSIIHNTSAL